MKRTNFQFKRHIKRTHSCGTDSEYCWNLSDNKKILIKICKHRCHSYFCKECANIKKSELIGKLKTALKGKSWRFLTITMSEHYGTADQCIQDINYLFNKFHKRFKKTKYNFTYFKVLEFTKRGFPHFHIFIDKYIPKQLIADIWKEYTSNYIVDITRVTTKSKLTSYLLKYFTKSTEWDSNKLYYLNRKRRFSYSRLFFENIPERIHFFATRILHKLFVDKTQELHEYFMDLINIPFINNHELYEPG